jgi:hypothetical protein
MFTIEITSIEGNLESFEVEPLDVEAIIDLFRNNEYVDDEELTYRFEYVQIEPFKKINIRLVEIEE